MADHEHAPVAELGHVASAQEAQINPRYEQLPATTQAKLDISFVE
jgi:hypothetical protein